MKLSKTEFVCPMCGQDFKGGDTDLARLHLQMHQIELLMKLASEEGRTGPFSPSGR
ncbi:MAG: hypothetical protein ACE5I4_00510 [Thermoplasmata archaeon]